MSLNAEQIRERWPVSVARGWITRLPPPELSVRMLDKLGSKSRKREKVSGPGPSSPRGGLAGVTPGGDEQAAEEGGEVSAVVPPRAAGGKGVQVGREGDGGPRPGLGLGILHGGNKVTPNHTESTK